MESSTRAPVPAARVLRVGSRCSQLALVQTDLIISLMKEHHPDIEFQVIKIATVGDKILDVALSKIGDKSLFTKDLEVALMKNEVDFVVHSLKDVPTTFPDGLILACVCNRESTEDAVVMAPRYRDCHLQDLPPGSVIGTSSLRRVAQLQRRYPRLQFVSVRGNLNTRLLKLEDPQKAKDGGKGDGQEYDALILAKAGLERLGWQDKICQVLSADDCFYAVGQGALGCECRADDQVTQTLLSSIHEEAAALGCIAERALMRRLEGGCSTPLAVCSRQRGDWSLELRAAVLSLDGTECVEGAWNIDLPLEAWAEKDEPEVKRARRESSSGTRAEENKSFPGEKEHHAAENKEELFIGIRVYPICPVGRARMACARRLGIDLAEHLLRSGADVILGKIREQHRAGVHMPEPGAQGEAPYVGNGSQG